jgi:RHS repeat-associated protein
VLLFSLVAIVSAGSEIHDIGFTGQRYDSSIDLVHFPYRTYDSNAGRFLQRDPSGYVDGDNLYEYVSGNALGATDELGLAGESFGRFLVRRLDELTAAGKINADEFTAKMTCCTGFTEKEFMARGGVSLDDLSDAWKISLQEDSHRQFITAVGIYAIPDLDIYVHPPRPMYREGESTSYDPLGRIHILGDVIDTTATTLALLDVKAGKMIDYWLSSYPIYDDYLKMFRMEVDAELFATKGNVHQAVNNVLRGEFSIPQFGYEIILEEAAKKGIVDLTHTETYLVARYLHDMAGREGILAIGEDLPSEFFKRNFIDAVIEAKTRQITLEKTLVPGPVTHAKRIKIKKLLDRIENSR